MTTQAEEKNDMVAAITPSMKLADIVLDHPRAIDVFERLGLDYCCQGHEPLAVACARLDLATDAVAGEIRRAEASRALPLAGGASLAPPADVDPRTLPTPALVARIISTHHAFLRQALPEAMRLAHKVAHVHGPRDERMTRLRGEVDALAAALKEHLDLEELHLFPALMTAPAGDAASLPEKARRELETMYDEHAAVGRALDGIKVLAHEYRPPEWACGTVRRLFETLHAIERDTHRHVHLENNVLGPRFGKTHARGH